MSWYLDVKTRESWAYAAKCFTPEECESIISLGSRLKSEKASVTDSRSLENKIRKGTMAFFDLNDKDTHWIYRRVTDYVSAINKQFWNYDLQYIETLQFTSYKDSEDFYGKHTDQSNASPHYRKLSFSVQLSDPESYEGADLCMYLSEDKCTVSRQQGDIIFFPSFVLHEVSPLLSGERYSLVGWVCGPPFK